MRVFCLILFCIWAAGCGSYVSDVHYTNSNLNTNANRNTNGGWTKIEIANNSNSNANVNVMRPSANATPTPGIPSAANMNRPFKPGTTPTPGIPDQETIRRQLMTPPANISSNSRVIRNRRSVPLGNRVASPTP